MKQPNKSNINPSNQVAIYRGPLRLPQSVQADDTVTVQLGYAGTLTTSVAGGLATVISASSQATSSVDWSSYANLYSEYRILSMDFHAEPWNKYNQPTSTVLAPVISVVDRQNSTALASVSAAAAVGSAQIHPPSSSIRRKARMVDFGEASFVDISSTPASNDIFYIKLFSSGNTASTNVYDYLTILMVQFRGRK